MPHLVHVLSVPESLVFLRGQVAFLKKRGWEVTVVTSPGAQLAAFGAEEDVRTHAVELVRRISPGRDGRSLLEMSRLLRRLRPDIVHSATPKGGLIGTSGAALARVPRRIYHLRGMLMLTARGMKRHLLSSVERTACRLATSILANSHSLREWAIDAGLCPPEKIRVLASGSGNGVDCDEKFSPERVGDVGRELRGMLGLPPDAPLVGFLGRLVRDKGIIELADAWERVLDVRPGAHLILGGVFEDRDRIPANVRARLESNPSVHLVGFVRDTPRFFSAVDVVVLPTHREGFPNVLLEAAAMQRPVVATNVMGAVDAVVDGVTGRLTPLGDVRALAAAIVGYLDDASLRLRHGRAGRARVQEEFRRERVWEALADYYDELLGSSPRPR